ncbi:MAG: glucose-6-phosphate isomerase [Halobacteriales archaeon]
MRIDLGNALADTVDPGIPREELDRLDEDVARAHRRIESGREAAEFGYAALNLPDTTDLTAIRERANRFADAETVLTVGIGGSALGAATIADALGIDGHHVLDNVDPVDTRRTLDAIDLDDTVVHVVSRSGTTAETLANFLSVREAMTGAGVDWTDRTVVTTGDAGPLRRLAERHDLPAFDAPVGVPGRFSALSPVGLFAPAVLGADIGAVLDGGASAADRLGPSLFDTPAYAYGVTAHALAERGATVNAMTPYAESLESFAEWFAQLWAESLGKAGGGQTPARALGATDQHSQLQLWRDGRRNTMVTLLRPAERPDAAVPDADIEEVSYLGGRTLGEILDAEFEATEASLAAAGRPNVRIEIDQVDAAGVGDLLYSMEAACVLAGELAGVDTFDQPAVEWGKDAARDLLGGEDTSKTRAVAEKRTLDIE